jgi:menaquinone-dependent protoporphyrinogen oxidase
MSDKILVSYATRYGPTREVAATIAATMQEAGAAVDVQPVGQVRDLDGYRAVFVLGPTENNEKD